MIEEVLSKSTIVNSLKWKDNYMRMNVLILVGINSFCFFLNIATTNKLIHYFIYFAILISVFIVQYIIENRKGNSISL